PWMRTDSPSAVAAAHGSAFLTRPQWTNAASTWTGSVNNMISQRDMYSSVQQFNVVYTPNAASYASQSVLPAAATIGALYVRYTVRAVDNVANAGYQRSYVVSCRQRLIINNPTNPSTNLPLSLQAGGSGMIANPGTPYPYAVLSGVT